MDASEKGNGEEVDTSADVDQKWRENKDYEMACKLQEEWKEQVEYDSKQENTRIAAEFEGKVETNENESDLINKQSNVDNDDLVTEIFINDEDDDDEDDDDYDKYIDPVTYKCLAIQDFFNFECHRYSRIKYSKCNSLKKSDQKD